MSEKKLSLGNSDLPVSEIVIKAEQSDGVFFHQLTFEGTSGDYELRVVDAMGSALVAFEVKHKEDKRKRSRIVISMKEVFESWVDGQIEAIEAQYGK